MADKYINPQGLQTIKTWVEGKIPTKTSDLTNDSGFITSSDIPQEIFFAEYGTTSHADVLTAYNAGKTIFVKGADMRNMFVIPLAFVDTDGTNNLVFIFARIDDSGTVFTYTLKTSGWTNALHYTQDKIIASGLLKGDGNGGVSAAVSGTDYQTPLPSQTGNSGKFLTTDGSSLSWAAAPTEIFVAEFGTTTFAEVTAAVSAGKIPVTVSGAFMYYYTMTSGSGDQAKHNFIRVTQKRVYEVDLNYNDSWSSSNTAFAPLASPDFSGTPTAPTATAGTNTTQIATTAFVATAIANAITDAIGGSY